MKKENFRERQDLKIKEDYFPKEEKKLVDYLHAETGCSNTQIRKWIDQQAVWVNDLPACTANFQLSSGDQVCIDRYTLENKEVPKCFYSDDQVIAVSKPCGWPTEEAHRYMQEWLAKKLYVVHRLDAMTSGLVLFALTERSRDLLHRAFKMRRIEKAYCAITWKGNDTPLDQKGWQAISDRLAKTRSACFSASTKVVAKGGQEAQMHLRRLSAASQAILWLCRPHTGRMHQIRAQLASRNCPIIGDREYGHACMTCTHPVGIAMAGHFLHAYGIYLNKTVLGYPLELFCPFPISWQAGLKKLGLTGKITDALINPNCDEDKRHIAPSVRKTIFDKKLFSFSQDSKKEKNSSSVHEEKKSRIRGKNRGSTHLAQEKKTSGLKEQNRKMVKNARRAGKAKREGRG